MTGTRIGPPREGARVRARARARARLFTVFGIRVWVRVRISVFFSLVR